MQLFIGFINSENFIDIIDFINFENSIDIIDSTQLFVKFILTLSTLNILPVL